MTTSRLVGHETLKLHLQLITERHRRRRLRMFFLLPGSPEEPEKFSLNTCSFAVMTDEVLMIAAAHDDEDAMAETTSLNELV